MHDLPAIFNIILSAAQLRAGPQDGKGTQKRVKTLWSGSARMGAGVKYTDFSNSFKIKLFYDKNTCNCRFFILG
jgi:hypothetical protein